MVKLLAEVAGCALIVGGLAMVAVPAALIAAGVAVVAIVEVRG